MNLSRREMVARSFGALVSGGIGGSPLRAAVRDGFFRRQNLELGIVLYMLGDEFEKDPEGTLKAIARIGYRRIEGFLDVVARPDVQAAMQRSGLTCNSVAIMPSPPGSPWREQLKRDIEAAQRIGVRFVGTPIFPLPARPSTVIHESLPAAMARIRATMDVGHWKRIADQLNEQGRMLNDAGLRLYYHNHNIEFYPLDGRTPLDILLRNTAPDLVSFEMDAGWVRAAGKDPVTLLRRHPHRFQLMHLKDMTRATKANFALSMESTEIGQGIIDWKYIVHAAQAEGIREFYVEQEPPFSRSRIEAAEMSFRYLAAMD